MQSPDVAPAAHASQMGDLLFQNISTSVWLCFTKS